MNETDEHQNTPQDDTHESDNNLNSVSLLEKAYSAIKEKEAIIKYLHEVDNQNGQ